jgi:protoporphyrinogen oxidase
MLVLGGGLAGLSAALGAARAGLSVCLLERDATLGGLARTLRRETPVGVFSSDITGHFLHTRSPYLPRELPWLLANLSSYERKSLFIWDQEGQRCSTQAPLQNHLHELPPPLRYAVSAQLRASRRAQSSDDATLETYLLSAYGEWVGGKILDLNRKTYGAECAGFRLSQYSRFFPHVDRQAMTEQLAGQGKPIGTYNSTYLYSGQESESAGIGVVADRLSSALSSFPNVQVRMAAEVTKVSACHRVVECVDGSSLDAKAIISTIPLRKLIAMIDDSEFNSQDSSPLKSMSIRWSWIGGKICRGGLPLSGAHWAYFPDETIECFRAGVYSNVDGRMAPAGYFSAWLEFPESFLHGDIADLDIVRKIGLCDSVSDVLFVENNVIDDAYCFENPDVPKIVSSLRDHGIFATGRAGKWAYLSMEDVIIEGLDMASSSAVASLLLA